MVQTVAECTSGMDPNTWNAYHIVSNRARSVCYAVRQQQFQRQTQFAVNQLALSAEGQLHLMEDLRVHYTGWPRKNATTVIVDIKDIVNKMNLFFYFTG